MTRNEIACPKCGGRMEPRHRHGVPIDLCPHCRGVWLDRGELDTIVERCSRFMEIPVPRSRHRNRPGALAADAFNWF